MTHEIIDAWINSFTKKFESYLACVIVSWLETNEALTFTVQIRLRGSFLLEGTVQQIAGELARFPGIPGFVVAGGGGSNDAMIMQIAIPIARAATLIFVLPLKAKVMTDPATWSVLSRGLTMWPEELRSPQKPLPENVQ